MAKAVCNGNNGNHCCWFRGEICPFFVVGSTRGRRFACSLRKELGNWDAVIVDSRYTETIPALYAAAGLPGKNCRDWPQNYSEVMATNSPGLCCYYSGS